MIALGHELRPSFGALLQLEEQTGLGLITLAKKFADGSFTLAEALAVLQAGIKGAGGIVPPDLGAQLVTGGLATLAPVLADFLLAALSGEDSSKKA